MGSRGRVSPIWCSRARLPPSALRGRPSHAHQGRSVSATLGLLLSGRRHLRARGRAGANLTSPASSTAFLAAEILVSEMTQSGLGARDASEGGRVDRRRGRGDLFAAIVSRELQLPCVVGTGNATTSFLCTGQEVTADGRTGEVYAGTAAPITVQRPTQPLPTCFYPLATRLYADLAVAQHAEEVAALPVDGVGLLRAEFMVAGALDGVHPRRLIELGQQDRLVDAMSESLLQITRGLRSRPVATAASIFVPTNSAACRAGSV